MINQFKYNNYEYKIIEGLNVGGLNFVICQDADKKLSYMKVSQLEVKSVFTPLDKLIKVLDEYKTERVTNIQKVLNQFVKRVNNSILKKRIKEEEVTQLVIDFNNYCNNNFKAMEHKIVGVKELELIDNFVKTREKKSFISKLCNIYGAILLVAIVGLCFLTSNVISWYGEGKESNDIVSDIISDTKIEEKDAFESGEVAAILDDQKVKEEVDVDKYSYNYWAYSNTTIMSVDFSELLEVNPDTVGWIYVNNTKINYPIVQSGDNSYYLTHSFKKTYSAAGWLFADFRSNLNNLEKNTVIYGHGRLDNVMFGSLDNVLDSNWYTNPENHIIKVSTPYNNMLWQVVSIYTIPSESYYLTHTFENDESYNNFLNTIVGRSIYDFNTNVSTDDHILTLSTCLDNDGNRIVLHAKLVKMETR